MSASIFVGANISSIYYINYTYKNVTKYNYDTGEPIITKEVDKTIETIAGTSKEILTNLGLSILSQFQEYYLGVYITNDINNYGIYKLKNSELTKTVTKVKTLLKEVNINLPIEIIFITDFTSVIEKIYY